MTMTLTTIVFSVLVLGTTGASPSDTPPLASPIPLRANGEIISVTTGHAAPYVYDFDGDGVQDLLVGEFGNKPFKGETTQKAGPGHPWTAGKLRFYRNHGTNLAPVYKDFSYVQAGSQDAQVPITCCVSFVPQFIDFNGDGRDDIVTGSYPGDVYFYASNSEGGFDAPTLQRNVEGKPVHAQRKYRGKLYDVHSITTELHDMDADEDLDMIIGSRLDGCYVIENIGSPNDPKWAAETKRLKTEAGKPIGGWEYGSNVHFTDWDGDGRSDIVVGSEDGGIFWHRNQGAENAPLFGKMKTLVSEQSIDERFLKLETPMRPSSRVKVHVVDYDGDGLQDMLVGDFGSKWTRKRTLTAEEKATVRKLEEELDALHEESSAGAQNLTNNDEREAYFDEMSKKTDPIYAKLKNLETHRSATTGYVWYYRQLPKNENIAKEENNSNTKKAESEHDPQVKILSRGSTITTSNQFPITVVIAIPEGWNVCGNENAMKQANAIGLPTSIDWDLPEGCTISNVTWQDADEFALYEEIFAIEANVDASGLTTKDEGVIAVDVSYQRCNKKSGVCILENERVELPVTMKP